MITSLVTGAAGFIGSHVAEHLLKMGHKVVVLDDLSGGNVHNLFEVTRSHERLLERMHSVYGSVNDDLSPLFSQYHFDYVFHCAAYAAEGLSHHVRRFNYTNNLVGSVNLVNQAVNHNVNAGGTVKRFVFLSSVAVYGAHQMPGREAMTPQPEDPYGIAKYAVELDLHAAQRYFGLDYTIFRPHNVYGERQNIGDKYRNVVGIFMNQALKNEPMTVFGDGEQRRAFTYVGDIAPIIAGCVEVERTRNEAFNVGSDDLCSVDRLAREVSLAMDTTHLPVRRLATRLESSMAAGRHEKVSEVFGPRPTTPLKIGLSKMAAWVRQHGARETKRFTGIEVEKNLPEGWK